MTPNEMLSDVCVSPKKTCQKDTIQYHFKNLIAMEYIHSRRRLAWCVGGIKYTPPLGWNEMGCLLFLESHPLHVRDNLKQLRLSINMFICRWCPVARQNYVTIANATSQRSTSVWLLTYIILYLQSCFRHYDRWNTTCLTVNNDQLIH